MHSTHRLLQHTARLTLFTRANCSLCVTAKQVVNKVAQKRSFDYNEVDVMASDQGQWRALYEYDTPVVGDSDLLSVLTADRWSV